MPTLKHIRVVVADDHNVVRDGLIAIISAQVDMTVVGEAEDGETAVRVILAERPDVVLLDLSMPKLDGVGVIEQVRATWPEAKIILLTTYDTDEDIERGLRAGARGYQLKDVRVPDLIQCIHEVIDDKLCVSPRVAQKLAVRLTQVQITRRELDVLRLLADGMSNKEIAATLFISESTVKLHLNALFEKLKVSSRTEAVKVAFQRGLIRFR